jgi:hypothetical protein
MRHRRPVFHMAQKMEPRFQERPLSLRTWLVVAISLILIGMTAERASGLSDCAYLALLKDFHRVENRELSSQYVGEQKRGVDYLTPQKMEEHRVFARDGELVDAKGVAIDTRAGVSFWGGKGSAIFVIGANGHMYLSNHQVVGKFHHSTLVAGGSILAGGEIYARQGKIIEIGDQSGHYRPQAWHMMQVLKLLEVSGINLRGIKLRTQGFLPGNRDAAEFLRAFEASNKSWRKFLVSELSETPEVLVPELVKLANNPREGDFAIRIAKESIASSTQQQVYLMMERLMEREVKVPPEIVSAIQAKFSNQTLNPAVEKLLKSFDESFAK